MSDTRSLAAQLTELDDEHLAEVLEHSPAAATRSADFFELAEVLLSADSVAGLLANASREVLAWLLVDEWTVVPEEVAKFFARYRGAAVVLLESTDPVRPRQSVRTVLRTSESPLLTAARTHLDSPPPPREALSPIDESAAFDRGYHALTALSEVLRIAERGTLPLTARQSLPLTEAQRIGETVGLDADQLQRLTRVALEAAFATSTEGRLHTTALGMTWQSRSTVGRWCELVHEWWRTLPFTVRVTLARNPDTTWGHQLTGLMNWSFPASPRDEEQERERLLVAELLGLLEAEQPSYAALALASSQLGKLEEIAAAALPTDIGAVYVQHDMTVVTTGPTTPSADELLHRIADTEHRSYAARFRISETSLRRGVQSGLTPDQIRDSLLALSPVPLPQPLEYLLRALAATSEAEPPGSPRPVRTLPGIEVAPAHARTILAAVARLRETEGDGSETAWIERQLREAARTKSIVLVTVRMPDGTEAEFALAPTSAASGRLRARDVRADVERTLPIALVAAVRAPE